MLNDGTHLLFASSFVRPKKRRKKKKKARAHLSVSLSLKSSEGHHTYTHTHTHVHTRARARELTRVPAGAASPARPLKVATHPANLPRRLELLANLVVGEGVQRSDLLLHVGGRTSVRPTFFAAFDSFL